MARRIANVLLAGLVLNICICLAVALSIGPLRTTDHSALPVEDVEAQLAFTFGDEIGWSQSDGQEASGYVRRGLLVRRLVVSGWTAEPVPRHHEELVLKVGWPFTTLRGFVRRVEGDSTPRGAVLLSPSTDKLTHLRILPMQIVWPGLLFDSIILGLLVGVVVLLKQRMARSSIQESQQSATATDKRND